MKRKRQRLIIAMDNRGIFINGSLTLLHSGKIHATYDLYSLMIQR